MRLGGYVIHGNAAPVLGRCLDALLAVCDEVVAVDSGSTDGSAELVRARGVRAVHHPWEGYGAARAAGSAALAGCDYVFFLDSDEWLLPDAIAALRAWKASSPRLPLYTLVRRDWAELPTGRFLFATDGQVRLARFDRSVWDPRQLVHEALPRDEATPTGIAIEHAFASSLDAFRAKEERYALLWALEAHARGRLPKAAAPQLVAHALRFAIGKGALFRGGRAGWALSVGFARYHARKYQLLRALRAGAHAGLVRAYAEGRVADLWRMLP